ncbi:MAG: signal peptidase I [Gammaproteobacteria bacterium]|nr:signal peptidase I [Gammaproteobacteria bacterium]
MTFDFAFFLMIGALITGIVWGLDSWLLAPKRKNNPYEYSSESLGTVRSGKEPVLVEYARSFFPVLLIVFLLRGFLVEPFRIPSGSMIPSLYIGDFILVNKFSYGIRMPVFNTKMVAIDDPQRGDVVVFRYPRDPSIDYIKRVIGLPGDHIAYYNKVLYLNGKPVKRNFTAAYEGPGEENRANQYVEDLDGIKHDILLIPGRPGLDAEYIVPEGHYFMMGDNRDNSNDSRYWGVVPDKYLVGKAFMIWMNWDNGIGFERIGQFIE